MNIRSLLSRALQRTAGSPFNSLNGNGQDDRLRVLPLVVLYITDGCNSRCVTCDIWKLPRRNMDLALIEDMAAGFPALGVRSVLLSGGEPMQHPEWPQITQIFRAAGVRVMLLTNGLLIKKHAEQIVETVDQLTVSLDGATPETYRSIRGVDGLAALLDGIRLVSRVVPVTSRTTVQRANFREMGAIVDVAKEAGVSKISFLPVDVSNQIAFGPRFDEDGTPMSPIHALPGPALVRGELAEFADVLARLFMTHAADFKAGRIAESPDKLAKLQRYFAAIHGLEEFEPPPCNAPHLSTVIEVDGTLRPCFFLPAYGKFELGGARLADAINTERAIELRAAYRQGERPECTRCVCPLYRTPRTLPLGF